LLLLFYGGYTMPIRKYPKDEPVPDEREETFEDMRNDVCIFCGHKRCVCDDRYEDYVEKHRKN
jgi:hypothetical protein